jgi:hypothetical protein
MNTPRPSPLALWPWVFGGAILITFILVIIFVIIPAVTDQMQISLTYGSPSTPPPTPPGGCKCYSDVWARVPGSSPSDTRYQSVESKDNRTFCGFEKEGYRWGCKPSDCTPACS